LLKENPELRTSFYLILFSIIFLFLIFLTSRYENLTYINIQKPNSQNLFAYNVEFIKWNNYDKINYYVKAKRVYTPTFESFFVIDSANFILYEKNKNIKGYISNALILGVHRTMIFNYIAFLSISFFSYFIFSKYNRVSKTKLGIGLSLLSSIWFFIVSNFGVWLLSEMYSKDFNGLILCYINAIPFLANSIISAFIFSILIFYSYEIVIKSFLKGKDVDNVELN